MLLNLIFFIVPLSCNFYAKDVKLEATALKMTKLLNQTGERQNVLAVTAKNGKSNKVESGVNTLGVSVSSYNDLYEHNSLQMTDGVLTDDLTFLYNDEELQGIKYALTTDYFSSHQGLRGTIFDKYDLYLYSANSNASFFGAYDNLCYITERTAKSILANNSLLKTYDDIINTTLSVKYGETTSVWKIGNIVLDQEETYEQLTCVYQDFILAYKLLPAPLSREVELCTYFDANTYFNINKITTLSKFNDVFFQVYKENFDDSSQAALNEIEEGMNALNGFRYFDIFFYLELGLVICLETFFCFVFLKKHESLKLWFLLSGVVVSLIIAYVPFWAVYKLTGNVYALSHLGVLGLLIVFAASILTVVAIHIYRKRSLR